MKTTQKHFRQSMAAKKILCFYVKSNQMFCFRRYLKMKNGFRKRLLHGVVRILYFLRFKKENCFISQCIENIKKISLVTISFPHTHFHHIHSARVTIQITQPNSK